MYRYTRYTVLIIKVCVYNDWPITMPCNVALTTQLHVVTAVLFRLRCYAMLDIVRTVMLERVALNARIVDSTHRWLAAVRWVCWLDC